MIQHLSSINISCLGFLARSVSSKLAGTVNHAATHFLSLINMWQTESHEMHVTQ